MDRPVGLVFDHRTGIQIFPPWVEDAADASQSRGTMVRVNAMVRISGRIRRSVPDCWFESSLL
ncbi:hypothetical protein NLX78_07960 [Paenibacillus sp. Lou8.1]|uniref:hypothetical protein n=1 Tax=Paenibacillus sp. Lou8.1 TaxID=2962041 RepID=UPI0020B72021|nr:hypothetical protein [Paenibacillus sp. Lou8.1]MCP3807167.1 hypothetical protein [Paenibacillus sp. Lou8.1]